ncbi:MAG: 2TM domain-containing protein [Actinomycetota bacterium]
MTTTIDTIAEPPGDSPRTGPVDRGTRREGRLFGALVLAAFPLYGVGSALLDRPLGLSLVLLNSLAVAAIGLIGFRLLRAVQPAVAAGYLAARVLEGLLLGGGAALLVGLDVADADVTGYLLAMAVLGIGSVPFCRALEENRWLPTWLAHWGVVGYVALAIGAVLELVSGWPVVVFFAAVGGLFELTLGVLLLGQGFRRRGVHPADGDTAGCAPDGEGGGLDTPAHDEQIAAFGVHLAISMAAVAICVVVNLAVNLSAGAVADWDAWWSSWVVVGCSIGLVVHATVVRVAHLR